MMRAFAADHLQETCGYMKDMAKRLAHSCVSQRDIQVCSCVPGVSPLSFVLSAIFTVYILCCLLLCCLSVFAPSLIVFMCFF